MNVLVTAASRQGATFGIAAAIGRELKARGLEVTVGAPGEVADVDGSHAIEAWADEIADSLAAEQVGSR